MDETEIKAVNRMIDEGFVRTGAVIIEPRPIKESLNPRSDFNSKRWNNPLIVNGLTVIFAAEAVIIGIIASCILHPPGH